MNLLAAEPPKMYPDCKEVTTQPQSEANFCLKTRPCSTEILLMRRKESNQTKTQNKFMLKCSYVLKGVTYGKLWYQNKCCDVHFYDFFVREITKFIKQTERNDSYQLL